jgi:AcrR family transcriptional regulator
MAARTRRTTAAVRSEVLRAAREVFGERGYAGTSTKEIAARAAVSEPLLFRHYGSKAQLFDEAVLVPLEQFIAEYVARWHAETDHGGTAGDLARNYISGLYEMLESNKGLVMAAVTAHAYEGHLDGRPESGAALDSLFARLEELVRLGWAEQGWPAVDPMLAVRLTFGLVMSAAVFDDWLFPAGKRPSKARVVDELTEYMLHGLTDRPPPEPAPKARRAKK